MSANDAKPTFDQLAGLIERVTFHNADNGLCVLRLKVKGECDLITLTGHAPSVTPGEYAAATGNWVTDRELGRQFLAVFVKIAPPYTHGGIERYLGSGMVKGVGQPCGFLAPLYQAQRAIAEHIVQLKSGAPAWPAFDCNTTIPWVDSRLARLLA